MRIRSWLLLLLNGRQTGTPECVRSAQENASIHPHSLFRDSDQTLSWSLPNTHTAVWTVWRWKRLVSGVEKSFPTPTEKQLRPFVAGGGSGVLAQVTAAGRTVSAALQPVHHVLQMSSVAAALAPHKQPLHHVVAHCAHAGTLVASGGKSRLNIQCTVNLLRAGHL